MKWTRALFKALYRCNYEVLPAEGDKAATAVFTARTAPLLLLTDSIDNNDTTTSTNITITTTTNNNSKNNNNNKLMKFHFEIFVFVFKGPNNWISQ